MSEHGDLALKSLRSIEGDRTNIVKATVALAQATLDVAAAIREEKAAVDRQTSIIEKLWNT